MNLLYYDDDLTALREAIAKAPSDPAGCRSPRRQKGETHTGLVQMTAATPHLGLAFGCPHADNSLRSCSPLDMPKGPGGVIFCTGAA